MVKNKPWWKSRTIWVNTVALVGMFLQQQFGFILDAEAQMAILIILNVILRFDTVRGIE